MRRDLERLLRTLRERDLERLLRTLRDPDATMRKRDLERLLFDATLRDPTLRDLERLLLLEPLQLLFLLLLLDLHLTCDFTRR